VTTVIGPPGEPERRPGIDVVGPSVAHQAAKHAAHEAIRPGLHRIRQASVGRIVDQHGAVRLVQEPQVTDLHGGAGGGRSG